MLFFIAERLLQSDIQNIKSASPPGSGLEIRLTGLKLMEYHGISGIKDMVCRFLRSKTWFMNTGKLPDNKTEVTDKSM